MWSGSLYGSSARRWSAPLVIPIECVKLCELFAKTLGIRMMKKILDITGSFIGSVFCLIGLIGLLDFTLHSLFVGLTFGFFGLWLFPNIRVRLASYFPPHINTKKLQFTTGLVLFSFCVITLTNNIYQSRQKLTKMHEHDLAEIKAAKERSENEEKKRQDRLAGFILKRAESISILKSLINSKEYEKAIAMAEQFSEFKEKSIEDLKATAKKELDSKINRQKELNAKNTTDANSSQQSFAKTNSLDCSLIGKFTFNATEAYARGISKENFVPVAWAGFAAGHSEILSNKESANAIVQIFEYVYDEASRAGAALNLGGTLKGKAEPSEYVRRKIPAVAQIELGLCVGKDNRAQETKSEYCVDVTLKEIGQGKISFNNASKELGKCSNGD